jgi:hypothetical protein
VGGGWQGASTRSHAGGTRSRESARLRCGDSEQQNPQGGYEPGGQTGTPTKPTGNLLGTFVGCHFGLLVWTSKALAAGSRMGSESRFGKAGVVSLTTHVLAGHKLFAGTPAGPRWLRRAADGSPTSDPWEAMRPPSVAAPRTMSMRDQERAKSSRNKGENVEKRRSQTQVGTISPPTELCRVDDLSISAMAPGDIYLIERLEASDLNSEPAFYAILACPLCGNQALISPAQYFGYAPVICTARTCPGFFRIIDEGRLVYLPVN